MTLKQASENFLLKDLLFKHTKVEKMATEIHQAYPAFPKTKFVKEVLAKFPELELKARISWMAQCLKTYLPSDYPQAVAILVRALPAPNNPDLSDDDFGDFIYAPYADYVAKNGCTKADLNLSLNALYQITQRFSAEDAIRYFLNAFPKETLAELLIWSSDSHYHVRRLASEGTRPKLPWSQKLTMSITEAIPLLETLFSDKTRFVTRSVANHLNDISKIDPQLVIKLLSKWQQSEKQTPKEMDYLIRHALRTLIKQGNPAAMTLLGATPSPQLSLTTIKVPQLVKMDTTLEFSFDIEPKESTKIIIDYIIYFQNKAGQLKSKKVFKLKQLLLKKDTPITVSKRHPLRQFMSTRTLYPGQHELEIQINGKSFGKYVFWLE